MFRSLLCLVLALGPAGETFEAGRSAVQAGNFAEASRILAVVTENEPQHARAWYLYGYSLHAQGHYGRAVEAHEKAATFELVEQNASYNAACAHARLGDADHAFEWLERAIAAGYQDLRAMLSDPDLASLAQDPRLRALLPIGEPATFREPISILRAIDGEAAGDRFGWIGRSAGDTDGDGVEDLLTSAPYKSLGGGFGAGRVYLYSGKTGELLFQLDGKPGDRLGIGIEAAGDVDGDGHADLLIGASGAGGTGEAYVVSGKTLERMRTFKGERPGDSFGHDLSGAGDQNGDGFADLLIGAPAFDGVGTDSGKLYLYSGKDGALLRTFEGERAGDRLGSAVDGHVSKDLKLVIIGEPKAGVGQRGRVSVYRTTDGDPELAFRIESSAGDKNLGGMFVSAVGDVNGDGVIDVYASGWEGSAAGIPGSGRVYVHCGRTGERLHELTGDLRSEGFGIGTAEAGDQDGDGCDDLVIGSWIADHGAPDAGRCRTFSGKTGEVLRTFTCTSPGETFGYDATNLGDWNGDGAPELLITSAESLVAGKGSGRVFVIEGGVE